MSVGRGESGALKELVRTQPSSSNWLPAAWVARCALCCRLGTSEPTSSMAHFGRTLNRGGSQRGTDAMTFSGGKSAGQRLVSSDERNCRQRMALTLSTIGGFPMTHHLECVALLSPDR